MPRVLFDSYVEESGAEPLQCNGDVSDSVEDYLSIEVLNKVTMETAWIEIITIIVGKFGDELKIWQFGDCKVDHQLNSAHIIDTLALYIMHASNRQISVWTKFNYVIY